MRVTVGNILEYARSLQGRVVKTQARQMEFDVEALSEDRGLIITPLSTGQQRRVMRSEIEKFVVRFNEEPSFKRGDYYEVTQNGSYLLAILGLFTKDVDGQGLRSLTELNDALEQQVRESKAFSADELARRLPSVLVKPEKKLVLTAAFIRNPHVIAATLQRARGFCEACMQPAPFIKASDGQPYLEVHHKIPLAEGGLDVMENTLALCPNCHRKAHYG